MPKVKQIQYEKNKCTGCRLCMLSCSWARSGTHRLADAAICVHVDEKVFERRMEFNCEMCSGCLACVTICPGGALAAELNDGEAN